MAAEQPGETLIEKIKEKIHGGDSSSSSSSDSDDEKSKASEVAEAVKSKIFRLFGREKPVHRILGGGKPADVFLWKNKKASGIVIIPEDLSVNIALSLRYEINRGFAVLREIATGRDVKKFLAV
ncbi:hypothetical protein B296_00020147 [Ensete ventricosum]|uniref:Reticulon domain-containing protein n=1 Tax=Ensete ventricosum TaxID=4639 RepID=A0A427A9R9_ENSVE|nr:hypothetical protein B296_00020147 [Ensete ventricosum]